jgi:hypothetical protein
LSRLPVWSARVLKIHALAGKQSEREFDTAAPRAGEGFLHACHVIASKAANEEDSRELLAVLSDPTTYHGGTGARCFPPGMPVEFESGIFASVCLECHWVYFYTPIDESHLAMTATGIQKLTECYRRIVQPMPPVGTEVRDV